MELWHGEDIIVDMTYNHGFYCAFCQTMMERVKKGRHFNEYSCPRCGLLYDEEMAYS